MKKVVLRLSDQLHAFYAQQYKTAGVVADN
jgi:hypothetical protein